MKNLFTLVFLAISVNLFAQTGWYAALPGDTIVLNVSGQNGDIQWQQSTDSITWTNIAGATVTPYELITTSSATNKRYFRAVVTDVLCPNATPVYSSIICYKTNTTLIVVGDWFHGGIVFYTDGTGHGLIAPQTNQSTGAQWGCIGTSIPGATSLTDGNTNTTAIYNNCGTRPIAASICYDLVLNGYSDWFLPAKDQLNYLYQQRALVGGFSSYGYWSSSEYNADYAWWQGFDNGFQYYYGKDYGYYVRCVRSFSPTDVISKTYSFATVSNQPVTASITTQPQPQTQNKCLGSSITFSIAATGTAPVTYQWKKGGVDILGATNNTYTKSGLTLTDEGIYTCEVTNLCRSILSDNAELKVIQISANAGTDAQICNSQNTILQATGNSNHATESGVFLYSWSPSAGLSVTDVSNPTASPLITTDYTVIASDQIGCTSSDVVNVFVQNPFSNEQVCLVTVDTITWKNKVIWEKTPDVGTEYYLIYKETGTNSYTQIGNVTDTQPGEYVDLFSQPEVHGDKYKITVLDTCGQESDLNNCFYHKTVNLTIAAFGSTMGLNWDDYVDESGNFVPFRYYIYRGTSPANMALYDSVSGSFNSYNDNNVFTIYYYMIGVKKSPPCNVTGSEMSFSNLRDNSTLVGIVEHNGYNKEALSVYPNPFKESTTINFYNPDNKTFMITLTDASGRVVRKTENVTGNEIKIEKKDLKSGIYFIELTGESRTYRGKVVVE